MKDALTTRACTRCDCTKLVPIFANSRGWGKYKTELGWRVHQMRFLDWEDVEIAYELACNYTYDELANHLPHMKVRTRRRELF